MSPRASYRAILFFSGLAIFFALMAGISAPAAAQITKSARVELNDGQTSFKIGPEIYLTQDSEKKLNYQAVTERHNNNLRGKRQGRNILNLGQAPPTWMVFSVTNNASTEDWVLDFGGIADGRTALAHKLMVRNDTAGVTYLRALREKDTPGGFGESLQGSALPVKIRKGQTEFFVIYLDAESPIANTIAPSLKTADAYITSLRKPGLVFSFVILTFFSIAGFFIAMGSLYKRPEHFIALLYYALNGAIFLILNETLFAGLIVNAEILNGLFAFTIITALALSKFFLNITVEEHTNNMAIIITGAFVLVTTLFNVILPGEYGIFDELLVLIPAILALMALIGLSFFQGQRGKHAGFYYAAAWIFPFAGLIISALSASDLIVLNALTVNAYWLLLLPQAGLLVFATIRKIRLTEEQQRHLRARENRAERSLARLQQSKESADQARLLRVIERERELMAELREREMQRTEEMRHAKEMADHANRAKSAFLAVVSHEIRTPMTGILGMVRLLNDTKPTREQAEYISAVQKSGDTMMALLNDILDFEKIESGNMEIEYIDFELPKLVQGVVTLMSGHAADKGIHLKTNIPQDFPDHLIGDPTRLRQVLLNLVSNAIKFTQSGGVTIHLRAAPLGEKAKDFKADYEIYCAVEDTGIGISESALDNLFSPFAQADKTVSRKYGGTGLGLAICRRLIDAMGGTISVKSVQDKGSTFFFTLLMKKGHSEHDEDGQKAAAAPTRPLRILIVEDNEMNRRVIQGFLEKDNHKPFMTSNAESAIEMIGKDHYDAVFTDIMLAGMDGKEMTRTIRALPDAAKAATPVVAITGNVAVEDIKTYHAAGMNGFIAKPIDPEKLRDILRKISSGTIEKISAAPPPTVQETQKAQPQKTAAPAPMKPAGKPKDEVAPIYQYLNTLSGNEDTSAEDFDSFADAENAFNQPEPQNDVLDQKMLQGLMNSLGKQQCSELIDGFIETADKIVEALLEQKKKPDNTAIRDRAHELKGMAANFGITELSKVSGAIEKAAKDGDTSLAVAEIEKLPEANRRAKHSIKNWLNAAAA